MLDLLTVGGVALGVGYVVGRIRTPRPTAQPDQETQQRRAQRPECTACNGKQFPDVASAREHARDIHNAPSREAEDHILDLPTVAEGR